jgi:hypothetical protein
MQLQMQQLQEQIQRMQLEYETKTNNPNNNVNVLKPSKPPTFHGDRRTNAEVWLLELENYFTVTNVTNGPQRIAFAVSQFRDLAVVWWKHTIQQNKQDQTLVLDWNKFKQTLLANYQPVEATETARAALYRLKQQGSVASYCDVFLRHLNNIEDMTPSDQLFLFKQGLQTHIAKEVNTQHPKTLSEAMSYAQRADIENRTYRNNDQRNRNYQNNNHNNYRAMNRFTSPNQYNKYQSYNNNGSNNSINNTNSNTSTVPMELSNINYHSNNLNDNSYIESFDPTNNNMNNYWIPMEQSEQIPNEQIQNVNAIQMNRFQSRYQNNNLPRINLTREQFDNYKRTGSCFYCGERGHMKPQCPKLNQKVSLNNSKN